MPTDNGALAHHGSLFGLEDEKGGIGAVKGTLDDPPVVIWQDRLEQSLICVAIAALATFLYWRFPSSGTDSSILAGLFAASMGWSAVVRTGLVLTPKGLAWRTGFRTFNYKWDDFERFFVASGRRQMVAGVFSEDGKRRRLWFLRWAGTTAFGGAWELPPQRIVDVLNEARTRWVPTGNPS
jgi:hypothetical protein